MVMKFIKKKEKLNSIATDNCVHLVWIPGHKPIEVNDKIDQLVRKLASNLCSAYKYHKRKAPKARKSKKGSLFLCLDVR